MRTTLTIDDRIAKPLKDLAHRSNQSFKDVVNETLRAGLTAKGAREVRPYVVRPAALGGSLPGINLEGAGALGRDRRPGVGGEDAAAEVIVVDANLLIYAIDSGSPHHARARPWLEQTPSRTVPVGIPWIVILAFVRLTTRPGIMRRPLGLADGVDYVASCRSSHASKSSLRVSITADRQRPAQGHRHGGQCYVGRAHRRLGTGSAALASARLITILPASPGSTTSIR
jgi:predicted nucleic acid-binding protein